mmetsp:Transcript_3754/g.4328  ORF Transcript_3754/g.4328 Transcript_3754/m.4328 type:complete len:87 (+) Transcript_3754:369-629(+)
MYIFPILITEDHCSVIFSLPFVSTKISLELPSISQKFEQTREKVKSDKEYIQILEYLRMGHGQRRNKDLFFSRIVLGGSWRKMMKR